MPFAQKVFINCPFDEEYAPLLKALIFLILYLDLKPKIALENFDSADVRLDKISKLILSSKYGIHDLSRLKAKKKDEYFRLNMPFELGLDVACKRYKGGQCKNKKILVLAGDRYSYQAALSDISGCDIKSHDNDAARLIEIVRHWFTMQTQKTLTGPTKILSQFEDFTAWNYDDLIKSGFSADQANNLEISEFIPRATSWLKKHMR